MNPPSANLQMPRSGTKEAGLPAKNGGRLYT